MATVPVFLCFGNSNTDGFGSLSNVSVSDWTRWTGQLAYPTTYPWNVTVPGVRIWTPKLPSGAVSTDTTSAIAASQATMDTLTYVAADHRDKWLYVRLSTAGQGQYRRIDSTSSGSNFDITAAWTTNPTVGCTIDVLTDSDTVSSATTTSITRINAASAPAYTSAIIGKWVVMLSGSNAGYARRIVSGTADAFTVEFPFAVAPSSGDGFRICTNANTVDGSSTHLTGNGSIRDLTFYEDYAYSFNTGYEYPNWKSYYYCGPNGFRSLHRINYLPELGWQLRQKFTVSPVFVHCGIPSATLATQYIGDVIREDYPALNTTFSWNEDVKSLDFHPSSPNGIYDAITVLLGNCCAAIIAEGNEPDIRGVFTVAADVDALSEVRSSKAEANMRLLITTLRQYIADNGYSKRNPSQIPWIIANVAGTAWSYEDEVNAAMAAIADDYSSVSIVDTVGYTLETDKVHIYGSSQVQLGKDFFTAWVEADTAESDATREQSDLLTLSDIRTKVKRRYERTVTSNSSTNTQIDGFINDALREFFNTVGDNAWFLRRMEQLTLNTSYPGTIDMPRKVKRLITIESLICPGQPVVWKGIGYTDQGRLRIALHDYSESSYLAHYIVLPEDLEQDGDLCLVPRDYVELIVVLACKRLAEAGGNAAIAGYYAVEVERLYKYVKRNMQTFDRMRQGQFTSDTFYSAERNGPGPLSFGF